MKGKNRHGTAIRAGEFRMVREAEFGGHEKRTLADFRRSTAVEATADDATPAALAHAMGNTLSASNALFATYCPGNLTSLRRSANRCPSA
jgi:hypothetical protein